MCVSALIYICHQNKQSVGATNHRVKITIDMYLIKRAPWGTIKVDNKLQDLLPCGPSLFRYRCEMSLVVMV